MVRFGIIGIVIAVAFTLYSLVDAAMTDGSRARGVAKPVWVVLIVLLPVIGGILWFVIGKGAVPAARPAAPDDDPRFSGTRMSSDDLDTHMRDLEARLRELDEETFPGEELRGGETGTEAGDAPAAGYGATGSGAANADGADPAADSSSSGSGSSGSGSSGTAAPGGPEERRRDAGPRADGDSSRP
ncbi:PLD nuclease N-terminal domain-containing protein [Leucobacter sp. PH1c]|uniref:PLD nuclease N-terminal domain-containing protein n=1 Tax=Leucobacter sp. PH1c TaxID=1397278 RepID=UPI000468A33D|nr:PLD nuclease N-terminal domain-containing protein [Leucobacter sp. PH1c]